MSNELAGLALQYALDALTNQIPRNVVRDNGTTDQIWDDCLLDQLADAAIQSGESGGGSSGKSKSRPPLAMDVLALECDMRDVLVRVVRSHGLAVTTDMYWADRLRLVVGALIKARDWRTCEQWTVMFGDWAQRIRDVSGIERARSRPLTMMACPACDERWFDHDVDDEIVRRPIMSALFNGEMMLSLTCASCGTWTRGASLDALVEHMMA